MIEWLKSWCKCDKVIEFDEETIEVLRAIYTETAPSSEEEDRSEEHTSELQSRLHLVCRLLLEKKDRTPVTATSRMPSSA